MIKRLWYRLMCYLGFHRCNIINIDRCNIINIDSRNLVQLECAYCDKEFFSDNFSDLVKARELRYIFKNELKLKRTVLIEKHDRVSIINDLKLLKVNNMFLHAQEDYG